MIIGLEVELFGKLIRDRAVGNSLSFGTKYQSISSPLLCLSTRRSPHGVAYLAAQAGLSFRVLVRPTGLVAFGGGAEGDAQVAVLVGVHREVAVGDIGEGEHPAVSAFVAFAGSQRCL